jgi:hypothetical protein
VPSFPIDEGSKYVAKKPPKKPAKTPKKSAPKRPAKQTAEEKAISVRLHQLGQTMPAADELLSIMLEIDRTFSDGEKLQLGNTAGRMAAAKTAFGKAVLSSDDPKIWTKSARDAAGLP